MIVNFDLHHYDVLRQSLQHYQLAYELLALSEKQPVDRANLKDAAAAALAITARLEVARLCGYEHLAIDLRPGELALIDRALRMTAATWQRSITAGMEIPARCKALTRIAEADSLLTKLRQARGLPW